MGDVIKSVIFKQRQTLNKALLKEKHTTSQLSKNFLTETGVAVD